MTSGTHGIHPLFMTDQKAHTLYSRPEYNYLNEAFSTLVSAYFQSVKYSKIMVLTQQYAIEEHYK